MKHAAFERALPLLVLALALALASGCGDGVGNDGPIVGGSCSGADDCAEACTRSGDFPDGMCTVSCDEDRDCPGGTACIDVEGGICLLLCDFDSDCRSGYECDRVSRRGHSGSASVCIDG